MTILTAIMKPEVSLEDDRDNLDPSEAVDCSAPSLECDSPIHTYAITQNQHSLGNGNATIKLNGNGAHKEARTTPSSMDREEMFENPAWHIEALCYFSYGVLYVFGMMRDFMRYVGLEDNLTAVEKDREGYGQLYKGYTCFYTRNIYRRIRDVWNRPIASVPGVYIQLVDRVSHDYNWTFEYQQTTSRVLNMGSYNYLGFAQNTGRVHEEILNTITSTAVGVCSSRVELGTCEHLVELEQLMARYLGVEACVVFGMGFATNSTNIQSLADSETLILSDQLNHSSLILGCRLSGATIRVFKHNDMKDLETKIRDSIVKQAWKKIVICVEGIYSMEGSIINLPALLELKRKYKCYLYLDEAHSIGALGSRGRGVTDYYGCDPNDVDILMGTFTKSFAAAGGYIAGRKNTIDCIRKQSYASYYATAMDSVIARQISLVVRVLMSCEGQRRICNLARNTRYFRKRLKQMGFIVFGHDDSPVVPVLLCFCPKIPAVIRLGLEKGLGFIGAGYPATPLTLGRVRFCISASHTLEMLDRTLEAMDEIGDRVGFKYSRKIVDKNEQIIY